MFFLVCFLRKMPKHTQALAADANRHMFLKRWRCFAWTIWVNTGDKVRTESQHICTFVQASSKTLVLRILLKQNTALLWYERNRAMLLWMALIQQTPLNWHRSEMGGAFEPISQMGQCSRPRFIISVLRRKIKALTCAICVTRAPLLYFIRSWVALSFKVCPSVRHW